MAGTAEQGGRRRGSRWRIVGWSAAALLLLTPLVAMQFTDEVNWHAGDFVFATLLLLGVGVPLELAVRKSGDSAYRAGVGVAVMAAFLVLWINGAVGILGPETNDANVMYDGVLAVGAIGAMLARFEAPGMARAMFATALANALVAVVALVLRLGAPESGPMEIVRLNLFFIVLFVGSGVLFQNAARGRAGQPARGGG